MCAAVSAYVQTCAAAGIFITGWRNTVCSKLYIQTSHFTRTAVFVRCKPLTASHVFTEKYTTSCPANMVYRYKMNGCNQRCRSLSQPDLICQIAFTPVDGCGCAEGTYLNEKGACVPSVKCPCYDGPHHIPYGTTVKIRGRTW